MIIQHTKECLEQKRKHDAWIELWPNHCRKCDGNGYHEFRGTMWDPPAIEPCGDCMDKGNCPRCGEPVEEHEHFTPGRQWPDNYYVCAHCGWTDETYPLPEGMNAPPFECYCYENNYQYEREVKGD